MLHTHNAIRACARAWDKAWAAVYTHSMGYMWTNAATGASCVPVDSMQPLPTTCMASIIPLDMHAGDLEACSHMHLHICTCIECTSCSTCVIQCAEFHTICHVLYACKCVCINDWLEIINNILHTH